MAEFSEAPIAFVRSLLQMGEFDMLPEVVLSFETCLKFLLCDVIAKGFTRALLSSPSHFSLRRIV